MTKILILCTGNSCRSQMAEGFLKSFNPELEVHSAGTQPSGSVHPKAIQVMAELGIDISPGYPKHSDKFIEQPFDFVITVCDHAREACPIFTGTVRQQLHIGFDDPAEATGTQQHILDEFRRIRDEINQKFKKFYEEQIAR